MEKRGGKAGMTDIPVQVSIGLPVFNGEKYLAHLIDSVLSQTFSDFELIISDNASTDRTQEMCLDYAIRDRRIIYSRNPENVGAAENANIVFRKARGRYFRWAGHDDVFAPDLLARCVTVLDAMPDIILCHTIVTTIDQHGKATGHIESSKGLAEHPHSRFHELILLNYHCDQIYGLIRSEVLQRTNLFQNYTDCDRTLLAEVGLYGRFYYVKEPLFFRRVHPEKSTEVFKDWRSRMALYNPGKENHIWLPHWLQFFDYIRVIGTVRLPLLERLLCLSHMVNWLVGERHGRSMIKDLYLAASSFVRRHVLNSSSRGVTVSDGHPQLSRDLHQQGE